MSPVLARVRRFLFWALLLLVGGYVIWGRVEAWRFSRAIAAIQARGEPVDYSYWFARQVTAEQRESAALYARAADFAAEAESAQGYRASQLDVDKPGGAGLSLDDIAESYRRDAPAMQLLDRATPMDFTEFGEDNRDLFENQIPLQRLGHQACLRADVLAARGDGEAASALVACVRLQRAFQRSYRSGAAVRVLGSFRILFRHTSPSASALAALQDALRAWPDSDSLERALLQDRVQYLSYVGAPRRSFGEAVTSTLAQPFLTSLARRRLASYDEALRIARLAPKERREAVAAMRESSLPARRGFLAAFWDAPGSFYVGYPNNPTLTDQAVRRTVATVLAVERYRRAHAGLLPDSLETLVPSLLPSVPEDPMVPGQPMIYRREPDGYVIYSVDANRRDDHGAFYGHGSAVAQHVGPLSPRDLGIRVPLEPVRSK